MDLEHSLLRDRGKGGRRRRSQHLFLSGRTHRVTSFKTSVFTLLITFLLTIRTDWVTGTDTPFAVPRSHPRFDFSSYNNNHRRQTNQQPHVSQHQPFSLPISSSNSHHFQRQQLSSAGDALIPASSSSSSAANTNANFNSHFTRPYIPPPAASLPLSSSPNSFPLHQRNGAGTLFQTEPSCGYDSCHETNSNSLNIHVVCHTHLDTGWVETYDEYYDHCEYTLSWFDVNKLSFGLLQEVLGTT